MTIKEFKINGESYICHITKKRKVKNGRMKINDKGEIHITIPWFGTMMDVSKFVNSNIDWINKTKIKMNEKKMYDFNDENFFILDGTKQHLSIDIGKTNRIVEKNGTYLMYVKEDNYDNKFDAFKKFLKKRSDDVMKPLIIDCCNKVGVKPEQVSYRFMKTRWGVCNGTSKKITLNTSLIMFTSDIIEYVIVHELCHFFEMNHSDRFWNHVKTYLPNYKAVVKKMKGGGLHYD